MTPPGRWRISSLKLGTAVRRYMPGEAMMMSCARPQTQVAQSTESAQWCASRWVWVSALCVALVMTSTSHAPESWRLTPTYRSLLMPEQR